MSENFPAVARDVVYPASIFAGALHRRGLLLADLRAQPLRAGSALLGLVMHTQQWSQQLVDEFLAQPHPLRYAAAVLETWTRVCDELAVFAEDALGTGLAWDADEELGRLSG